MFNFFKKKKSVDRLEEEIKNSFNSVKGDFEKVGQWINHFDSSIKRGENDISDIRIELDTIKNELGAINDFISLFGSKISKHQQPSSTKQTGGVEVQNAVQTAVQMTFIDRLTITERAIIGTLMGSDVKLSYEDISLLLGKDKSTIRGQINAIKQKSESLIQEETEINGKKRVYIPEEVKQMLFKSQKVRIKQNKKRRET